MVHFLTVDVGTDGCKIVLFDSDGRLVAQKYTEYPTYVHGDGFREQDPNEWWRATCNGTQQVLKTASVRPEEVTGVGCGGHFPTLVLVGKDGNVLRRAIIYSDMRGAKQTKEIFEKCGAEISNLTGLPERIFPGLPIAKLLWLRENEPKIIESTHKVMGAKDFINFRLTGNVAVDYFEACWTGLASRKNYSWMQDIADELRLRSQWFGEIHRPQEVIGEVTGGSSAETGLRKGTPVVCGSGDGMCNVIGSGLLEAGVTMESAGATDIIAAVSNQPVNVDRESITSWSHPDSQNWVVYTSTSSAGLSLRWFRDRLAQVQPPDASSAPKMSYQQLDDLAEKAPVGSGKLIFLPYLDGEYSPFIDLNARGVFLGVTLETERKHLVRAILEGVAFSLRHVLEHLAEYGIETRAIRSSGGGSRSKLWNQIKADVTGKPVSTMAVAETGCLGAAVLASVGVGEHADFKAASQSMVRIAYTTQPNSGNHETYSKLFATYKEAYLNLKDLFAKISAV
jgi:xylulokinase